MNETLDEQALRIWNEMDGPQGSCPDPVDFARSLHAEWMAQQEPDGEVVAGTGSLNDLVVIKWVSDYHPKIGDKIYAAPVAKPAAQDCVSVPRELWKELRAMVPIRPKAITYEQGVRILDFVQDVLLAASKEPQK